MDVPLMDAMLLIASFFREAFGDVESVKSALVGGSIAADKSPENVCHIMLANYN